MQDKRAKIIGLSVIVLIAAAGTGAVVLLNKPEGDTATQSSDTTTSQSTPTTSDSSTTAETTGTYKDGIYSADGSYRSPGGTETVGVTVTLKDNAITAVNIETHGTGNSAEYQSMFKDGVGALTVGKNIDEVKLSRVSGSSLTSTGFNNALETIKSDAKA